MALVLGSNRPPGASRFAALLGRGSALWTPRLQAGIELARPEPRPDAPPIFVVGDGRHISAQVLAAVAARGMRPLAAACAADTPSLARLARLVLGSPRAPALLVALHRPVSTDLLVALAQGPALLLLAGDARRPLLLGPAGEAVSPASLASALRIPVVTTPGALAEAAHLAALDLGRHARSVTLRTDSDDARAVLAEVAAQAGLELDAGPATLALVPPGAERRGRALHVLPSCWTARPAPLDAGPDTLAALAALARLPGVARAGGPRPRARLERAARLLDRSEQRLSPAQLRPLLAAFGIGTPPGRVATSASMAADIARQVGLPVEVEAVGPGLRGREAAAARSNVESYSATRQAFREVLLACSRMRPSPVLDGVLVHSTIPGRCDLRLALVWHAAPRPLLLLHLGDEELARLCPLSAAGAREVALRARRLDLTPGELASLARFIHRLSWLGEGLAQRMSWLRLERVSLPRGRRPPLVLDAWGVQTEGLRNPLA